MKTISIVIAVAMICCISCKKKNEAQPIDHLTSGNWKIVKLDVKVGITGVWTDGLATLADCRKDDEWIFLRSGVYQVTEGASKCNLTDPQIYINATWSFSADGKKIIFPGLINIDWTIEKLDASQFISNSSQDIGPSTYYYRRTMQH